MGAQGKFRALIGVALVATFATSCDRTTSDQTTASENPVSLANNGRAYTGRSGKTLAFKSFRSDSEITLCLDHIDFMQQVATAPGYVWLPTIPFTPPVEVRLSRDGTIFPSLVLPDGIYGSAALWLSSACTSGKSVQVTTASGTFSMSGAAELSFNGSANVTPLTGEILFETQSLVTALDGVTSAAQLTPKLFDFISNMYSAGLPYNGVAAQVPGVIEAENFDVGGPRVAYTFANSSNGLLLYRPEPYIKIEPCSEGGYDLYGFNAGDWVTYSINVQADGLYTVVARVAATNSLGTFKLQLDGAETMGPVVVPSTGGAQTWTDVSYPGVFLPRGRHYLRFVAGSSNSDTSVETFSLNSLSIH